MQSAIQGLARLDGSLFPGRKRREMATKRNVWAAVAEHRLWRRESKRIARESPVGKAA